MADLTIFAISEDSFRNGHLVVQNISRFALRLLDPDTCTNKIAYDELPPKLRKWVSGNKTVSRELGNAPEAVDVIRTIATELCKKKPVFVVYHMDGDTSWKERRKSIAGTRFDKWVRDRVERLVVASHPNDPKAKEAAMGRLFLMCPFYSIEAWLYQNDSVARKLCKEKCSGVCRKAHLGKFKSWVDDRTLLDEIEKPKDLRFSCLPSAKNVVLSKTEFPAAAVYSAGQSFHTFVEELRKSSTLVGCLFATHA